MYFVWTTVQRLGPCNFEFSLFFIVYFLQTPVWEESDVEDNLGPRNKRSNSLGSGDQKIKEVCTFCSFLMADS